MDEKLKIKITIGGRVYPLTINNETEEEGMRKAANKINDLVMKFERNYAVNDKQDVLAMCALQFASQLEIQNLNKDIEALETTKKLNEFREKIEKHLE